MRQILLKQRTKKMFFYFSHDYTPAEKIGYQNFRPRVFYATSSISSKSLFVEEKFREYSRK